MTDIIDLDDSPHPADHPPNGNLLPFSATARNKKSIRTKKKVSERPVSDSRLPLIRMTPRLHEAVDAACESLRADLDLYQRDTKLVRVLPVAPLDAERERMAVGTPLIRTVSVATLRERMTRLAAYERWDARAGDWKATIPSNEVVKAVDARGVWPGVRPLSGVIETPSIRPDGTVLDVPGYDGATGYLYLPGREYPAVPRSPNIDEARAALLSLVEPFAEFPLANEAQRFVPIAALMTLVARPAIRGACPGFIMDASTRGSGKSLMQAAVTTMAQGREAALITWRDNEEEVEKILGGQALKGATVVCWDNATGVFGGAPVDKVLTCADRVELRILGKTEVPAVEWRAVMLAGGNNISIAGDTTRRVLVCRLEPMMERPEERTGYAIPDLKAWCREHHPRCVTAALTVLRAYVVAGRPSQGLAGWGSFEQWRDLIGNAIAWAGGPDVMACRPTIAGNFDDETSALRTLLEQLPVFARTGTTINHMLTDLYSPERMRGNAPPDGFDALREALETLAPTKSGHPPNHQKLGLAFKRCLRRVVGGRYLDKAENDTVSNVARWLSREAGR